MAIRLKMTTHFQSRMVERGIQIDHVKQVIHSPDSTENREDGTIVVTKELTDGRTIEAVYSKEGFRDSHDYLMITAYYKTP